MLFRGTLYVAVITNLVLTGLAMAAPPVDKKLAITDIRKVDGDFAYQGEYLGMVLKSFDRVDDWQRIGLQVVALGAGQFQAVQYLGGLPGNGWRGGGDKLALTGQRYGKVLALAGGDLKITVRNDLATVQNSGGRVAGYLRKVHRTSPTLGALPPVGSWVLFDGTGTEHFDQGRMTEDNLLREGTQFSQLYGDFSLHLEFRLPYMPHARGQGRSNSGVYLQSRYEVQILDSFGLEGKENECGGLYRYRAPEINMCYPPLAWQTYDVDFTSPRFNTSGTKIRNARLTVRHNGVLIHNNVNVEHKTGAGAKEGPNLLPTKLQNHRNPVRFRNIWIVDHGQQQPFRYQPSSPGRTGPIPLTFRQRRFSRLVGLRSQQPSFWPAATDDLAW